MLHDRLCCFISIAFIVLMFGMLTCCSYVQSLSQINVFVGKLWEIANPPLPTPPPPWPFCWRIEMCWTQLAFLQQDKRDSATRMFVKSSSDWLEAFSTSSKISQTVPLHRSGEISNNKRKCKLTDSLTDLFMVILKFSFAVSSSLQFFTSLSAKPHDSCGMGPQLRYPLHFVTCLKHDACA